jgi:dolichol-phosphate mannosyltransferase
MARKISIILPFYNEEKNVYLIYESINRVLDYQELKKYSFEIICIDDGSRDETWQKICEISRGDKRIVGIRFSRNFGHQYAIEAGLKEAKGDAVIMLDSDLQHPPEIIPSLIKKWEEGFDIVNTKRIDDSKVRIFKRVSSRLFYNFLNSISKIQIEPGSSDFRLLDRKVADILNKMSEKGKFYRGLVNWVGFRKIIIPYHIRERKFGRSSYSLKKMLELARVGITSFSYLPMKFILIFGVLITLFSVILAGIAFSFLENLLIFATILIISAVLFSNGVIVTILGIISVYQINMYDELQGRPNYIIGQRT